MANVEISLSVIPAPLTRPILSGKVTPEGVELHAQEGRSVDDNSRRMLELGFDVGEMSLATYVKAREQGVPLIGLPLFTGRRFLQGAVTVMPQMHMHDPGELRGKRVGLPQFWMTSSVWHRLILRQMHGVSQAEVHWVTTVPERMEALSIPEGVDVRYDSSGRSPRDLLLAGEVDAVMSPGAGAPASSAEGEPVPAYADPAEAQREYYQRTGILPIMHMLVMKEELVNREPWLIESLCDAFQKSKEQGLAEAKGERGGGNVEEIRALVGDDPWPYSIEAARHVLETFLGDAHDQGLTQRVLEVDELFPAQVPARYR